MPLSKSEFTFSASVSAPGRDHRNLVCHNLGSRDRFRDGFGLCLVAVRWDVPTQGNNALVAILTCRDIFKTGLIQRGADLTGNIG